MVAFDSRTTWNAAPPKAGLAGWAAGNPVGIAWHYIGGTGHFTPGSHDGCLAKVRSIQTDEMGPHSKDHFLDISYNLCVCPHGRVIDGRGIGVQSGAQLGGNDSFVGVLLMLNVDDPMIDAFKNGAADARSLVLARFPRAVDQRGHRDVANNPTGTVCPGDAVGAWIDAGGAPAVLADIDEELDLTQDEVKLVVQAAIAELLTRPGAVNQAVRDSLQSIVVRAIEQEATKPNSPLNKAIATASHAPAPH